MRILVNYADVKVIAKVVVQNVQTVLTVIAKSVSNRMVGNFF